MRARRLAATVMAIGLAVTAAACSSSDGGASGSTSTSAGATATTGAGATTTFVPVTTVAPLSAAGQQAATNLTDGSGFRADQSACMVSVVVSKVGETDGLPLFGSSTPELTTAQQDALVAAFEGCLSADDVGGLVGVTFQALATQVGGQLSREQIVCVGRAMVTEYTLEGLLFDEQLLPRVFADKPAVTTLLSTCLPAPVAESLAGAAVAAATESTAPETTAGQTTTSAP